MDFKTIPVIITYDLFSISKIFHETVLTYSIIKNTHPTILTPTEKRRSKYWNEQFTVKAGFLMMVYGDRLIAEKCPTIPGFYLGFSVWERSLEWPKASKLPRGSRGACPPRKCFGNEYWDMILSCGVLLIDREYLLHVHWPHRSWMIFPI